MLFAKIKTQFEGIHYWRDAKGNESFLKNPHRHIFYITVHIEQFHNDRDVEYIAFKRWLTKSISKKVNYKSCEMIAQEIAKKIKKNYGNRKLKIEVMEDNENGALLELL
jgi:hypothetical protein